MIAPGVTEGVELAPYTTYKVGGEARWFAEPDDLESLRYILGEFPVETPVVVLGRGSNVVIADTGFDGLVLRLGAGFSATAFQPDGRVVSGAATALPVLARDAAANGRSGLGFYVGIPGSVGGAVRMNAGGHGSQTADVLESTIVLDRVSREVTVRPVSDLGLAYRTSDLGDDDIVVQATFRTGEGDPTELSAELRAITRWRKVNQPGGTLNAGSVFKNPPDRAAGAILDDLGMKGWTLGPVAVSEVHANFLVADRDAKASDIHVFVHTIRETVFERTGVMLEPEIRFVGDFEQDGST